MKKLVLFSILATSLLAAPTVQAQMRHGRAMGHRGPMAQGRGWSGNHGHMQTQRFQYRNHRYDPRGFRGNRNNYHTARNWAWGRGQHRGFAQNQPRGWAHNNYRNYRGPYQARGYGHYRQPYRPTAYGFRSGFNRGHQAAYGPGYRNHQNYRFNRPANTYRSGAGNYNGQRPSFGNPGTPGAITQTSATSSRPMGYGSRTWSHGSNQASGGTWSGHTNTSFSPRTTRGGSTTVASD
jgi:hypothetical protein